MKENGRKFNILPLPLWRWAVVPSAGLAMIDCVGVPFYTECGARSFLAEARRDVPDSEPVLVKRRPFRRTIEVVE